MAEQIIVQLPSCVRLFVIDGLKHTRPPHPHHLPKYARVHVHCISDAIKPSHPLLLLLMIFPTIRDFSNEVVVCIR